MSEFSRKCPCCGKMHDAGFQDKQTGEMIYRIKECIDCFMKKAFSISINNQSQQTDS